MKRIKRFVHKIAPPFHFKISNWHFATIVVLSFGFFLAGLNQTPVPTLDGAIRAVEAKNILANNQWFPITLHGETITDHPPLYIWLLAISYKFFGINDFAMNLVGRLAAMLTVLFVYLIAVQAGFSRTVGLASALILLFTRDFILSSVRGYIEPLVCAFTYGAFWLVLLQKDTLQRWPAFLAGICIWLAAYSKGPPALWPFLVLASGVYIFPKLNLKPWSNFNRYLIGFFLSTAIWTIWVQANSFWPYWKSYWIEQVLNSAVKGRGGAQSLDLFYFIKILGQYYWPWLPLLLFSLYRCIQWTFLNKRNDQIRYSWFCAILGLGFLGGFSIVKWKFWYYIAPAYPAFALLIGISLKDFYEKTLNSKSFIKTLFNLGCTWIIIVSVFPITLHRDRTPSVTQFKNTILHSNVAGPVWFIHSKNDHNLVGSSGEWYFDRIVNKVKNKRKWKPPTSPAWIIVETSFYQNCQKVWCKKSIEVQTTMNSSLLYYKE